MRGIHDRLSRTDSLDFMGQQLADNVSFRGDERAAGAAARSANPIAPILPPALIDTVPGDTSTTFTLTVGAAPIVSAIDTIADEDFYVIQLVAGHEYQIAMYGYTPQSPTDPIGPNGAPLLDSYLEIYDAAGNLITAADGGSDTTFNTANSGFDALLTFTATATGTYYINARAFDNIAADGDRGDLIGDYGLYALDVTGSNSNYTPYYSPASPLYAIDWGTQVNKVHETYRNPDGNEGTHPTGNPQSPVDPGALLGHPGQNVISIYFAHAGDIFVSNDPTNPGLPPATITATGVQQFEHDAVMTALAEFSKVADIVYVEVSDRSQADFIYTSYAGTPGPGVSLLGSMSPPDESDEGLAQFNSADYRWNARDLAQGGFSFVTLIHEFGHGHGLAHPHDNGGHSGIMNGVEPEGAGVADYTTGDYHLNQSVFTMMSYEDGWQDSPYANAPTNVGYGYLGGLMAFDIAAIQDKYGVNEEWATGNDTYVLKDVNAAGTYYSSIWDAGGTDSIIYSGARNANIDLRPATLQYETGGGGWVSYAYGIFGGFTIANGVTIENATSGSGNDTLTGNAVANILDGGAGTDTMSGGLGNDTYYVDNAADVVIEGAGGGNDTVYASVTYTLAAAAQVELLSAISPAATDAIDLYGNGFANRLVGNAGANLLSGGGGADELVGLGGNDVYLVDNGGDVVFENVGGGFDIIYSTISYAIAANSDVEILSVTDHNATSALNFTGNQSANYLYGNAGANVLNGGGGADAMLGFGGNDIYFVDNGADYVGENIGGGGDIIYSTVSYALDPNSEVEVLSVTDHNATSALAFTGNQFANYLYGNAGANLLYGGGGVDVMLGFGGNDTFYVDSAGDYVGENIGGGSDTIYASVSYALQAGSEIEILSVTDHSLTTAINFSGNEFANYLYGNAGNNVLFGGGGADVMLGFGGNDSYYVDNAGDYVLENAGGGTDIIYSSMSYALGAGNSIEVLSVTDHSLTTAINFTGNEIANYLYGNAGANVLNGGGGADVMIGFGGADIFAFTTALGNGNVDYIDDFVSGTDKIALDDAIFTGLGPNSLPAGAFVIGTAAQDADDRIIYDSATGGLYFDADGNGAGAAVQFATLNGHPPLVATDFMVI